MRKRAKKIKFRGVTIRERINASGTISFRVECPLAWFGRTAFRQFTSKERAKGFIDHQQNDQERFGSLANSLTTDERLDAANALEALENSGVSLVECAEFYLKYNRPVSGDITLRDLTEKFIEARKAGLGVKRGRPLRQRSLDDLRSRLGKFNLTFGSRLMKDVSTGEIESWLHRDEWSQQTRQNYFRILHTFFEFATTKGYRADNPMKTISKPCPDDLTPEVLSLVQCEKLLEAALDTEEEFGLLGYVVLGMYCGIRSAELERLDWAAVDMESRHVTISAKIAKARSIRNVEIPENAMLWLMQCNKRAGDIRPPQFRERFDKLKAKSGIKQWPHNGLRHSAGSYHYALLGDSALTAGMLGHTQDSVLFKHYRALTKKKDAVAFYELVPPSNVNPSVIAEFQ